MKTIAASELILNEDGSIYHLHLQPEQLANTIITVGDPDRVEKVSKHFDRIEHVVNKREFVTHTGYIGDKRLSVISTGIGTDNIDIVFNELDALVNVDFKTRLPKATHQSLDFIRIGTSGCMRPDIPVDSFLVSNMALGMDGLLGYYQRALSAKETALAEKLKQHLQQHSVNFPFFPEVTAAAEKWTSVFDIEGWHKGITLTASGFYAPQNRTIRAKAAYPNLFEVLNDFSFEGLQVTNLEMETSGILGLANLLGHQAVSISALLANRIQGTFSKQPEAIVDKLIEKVLDKLLE